ncbi:MAG: DUF721 domain-containing protein [Bacteroidetes bacterium]|nr:DUF721 domain-containing protein [Bacteroidota bacterium]MCH8170198.1 DUF721 domain-containing protein [Bacteroidota bacterium]MCH8941076.1 DUF721 domain-containing protein [Bacteroidota bacterium]
MPDNFKSLKEVFEKEPRLKTLRNIINAYSVVADFNIIFPEFKKMVIPVKVEKKSLFLSVENSVWRNELKFKEKEIIEKINNHFKTEIIKWLKFI